MMKNLLAPYEQRPWAQTNWILVRLWRVSGGPGGGERWGGPEAVLLQLMLLLSCRAVVLDTGTRASLTC